MGYVVKMPKLGLEMEQGTVLEWTVEEGEPFSEGDQIAEVESEKSIGEVRARQDGVLRRIYVAEGESVPPGDPIGIAAGPDEDIADLEAEVEADAAGDVEAQPAAGGEAGTEAAATGAGEAEAASGGSGTAGGATAGGAASGGAASEVKASPRARKRAEELGVDLAAVEGSGFQGAVTEEDVEAAAEAAEGVTAPPAIRRLAPEAAGTGRYGRATAVADPAAAEALLDATEAVRSAFEERVTFTDVALVVASATLADRPTFNATYAEATHQLHATQDVALATTVDGEPVAGVLQDVGSRSVTELVEARREIEAAAHGGQRPTFTLAADAEPPGEGPLVNPPGVATLEVDPSGQRAVPAGEGVDLQPLVRLALVYDTRAVDAADAERFLERFAEHAERAAALVLGSYRGSE